MSRTVWPVTRYGKASGRRRAAELRSWEVGADYLCEVALYYVRHLGTEYLPGSTWFIALALIRTSTIKF